MSTTALNLFIREVKILTNVDGEKAINLICTPQENGGLGFSEFS